MPERATYAGAKSFMLTFTETVAAESISGLRFQVVLPGMVATEYAGGYSPTIAMSPEDVVRASFAGLERGELVCVPGLDQPSLLSDLEETRHAILGAGNRRELSARYSKGTTMTSHVARENGLPPDYPAGSALDRWCVVRIADARKKY